jgi:hypothetical protein
VDACARPKPLAQGLLFVVLIAQTLRVLRHIEPAFLERLDVIALSRQLDQAEPLAFDAQRVVSEQLLAHALHACAQ